MMSEEKKTATQSALDQANLLGSLLGQTIVGIEFDPTDPWPEIADFGWVPTRLRIVTGDGRVIEIAYYSPEPSQDGIRVSDVTVDRQARSGYA